MNRLNRGRIIAATLVALGTGGVVATSTGQAATLVPACTASNSQMYPPTSAFPYYRLHTSRYACYAGSTRYGWVVYSMHHWRCGDFNCHSFWLKHRR